MVVSMGPAGALLVTREEVKHINTPPVKKQSAVGAGDSMVAGLVWMLEQNKSMLEAVQFGVACGSAATMSKGTQLFRKEDVYKLFDWIKKDGS
jgi:6-phosphofructokinase 2